MAMIYAIIVSIVTVKCCDDDTLLIPERLEGDTTHGTVDNLLDGSYGTYWRGDTTGGEYVYFYYPSEVEVKWIYVQKWDDDATNFEVYVGERAIAYGNLGDATEKFASVTLLFNDVYTDTLRFYFYRESAVVAIARAEVHGCYTSSMPVLSYPPSISPTSSPTMSPTVSSMPVLSYPPSISPTSSPTVSPTVVHTDNNSFQVKLGAIELFSIVFLCLCLCGVVLFLFQSYRRDKRAMRAWGMMNREGEHGTQDSAGL